MLSGPPRLRRSSDLLNAQWTRLPESLEQSKRVDKGTQTLLQLAYRDLVREVSRSHRLDEVGFRAFSQFDEDGILLYLFTLLGIRHKTVVRSAPGSDTNATRPT